MKYRLGNILKNVHIQNRIDPAIWWVLDCIPEKNFTFIGLEKCLPHSYDYYYHVSIYQKGGSFDISKIKMKILNDYQALSSVTWVQINLRCQKK